VQVHKNRLESLFVLAGLFSGKMGPAASTCRLEGWWEKLLPWVLKTQKVPPRTITIVTTMKKWFFYVSVIRANVEGAVF
jgi:hypothetical protein